jgi:hypothetical protein
MELSFRNLRSHLPIPQHEATTLLGLPNFYR